MFFVSVMKNENYQNNFPMYVLSTFILFCFDVIMTFLVSIKTMMYSHKKDEGRPLILVDIIKWNTRREKDLIIYPISMHIDMTSSTSLHPIQNINKQENLIVTLQTWLQHETKLPLIDLRSHAEYQTKRLQVNQRTIVHLPFEELQSGERSCELPPRNVQFAILVPSHFLNLDSIKELFFGRKSKATQQSRKPWLVLQIILEHESLWSDAESLNIITREALDPSACQPRLWKPDVMVENILLPLLIEKFKTETCSNAKIWDLGSGAGRDVCFLAEELKSNNLSKFTIVGFDNHKGSAARSNPFWNNRGVANATQSTLLNLQHVHLLHDAIQEEENLVCLYAVRFLNRTMLRFLSTCNSIQVGCIFAMSHFCKETKDSEWNFDHPNVKHVLERNELIDLFSVENGWDILHDSICMDGDHGRTLIHFCARKM